MDTPSGSTPYDALGDDATQAGGPSPSDHAPAAPCTLTWDALARVLEQLPPNEVACTARLLCKETARRLSAPQHRTLRLSQPIPPHAVGCWRCGEEALRHLSFWAKLGLLSVAATSGCEANLEVAWRLVQLGVFPDAEVGDVWYRRFLTDPNPGTAAVRAGHAHLLPWLVAHHWPIQPAKTLEAAAEHCDLEVLQWAWALLEPLMTQQEAHTLLQGEGEAPPPLCSNCLTGAARSRTPDAASKLQWLVEEKGCALGSGAPAAAAAARGGGVACLQWLQQRGCDVSHPMVLYAAFDHGSMEVVRWAWERRREDTNCGSRLAWGAAGSGVEGITKLRWLQQEQGVDLEQRMLANARHPEGVSLGFYSLCAAARHGRLEAVRYLVEECGVAVPQGQWDPEEEEDNGWGPPPPSPPLRLAAAMAEGGDRDVMTYLLQRGAGRCSAAYEHAARRGDLGMVRWLIEEGFDPWYTADDVVRLWPPRCVPGHSDRVDEDCLAALQAVLGAGGELHRTPHAKQEMLGTAVGRGSLPLVRWLVEERGYELGDDTLYTAAATGSTVVLEWLVARGCPHRSYPVGFEYDCAGQHRDRATLQLLRQLGVPWSRDVLWRRQLLAYEPPLLQWFADNGLELSLDHVRQAVDYSPGADSPSRAWLAAYLDERKQKAAGRA